MPSAFDGATMDMAEDTNPSEAALPIDDPLPADPSQSEPASNETSRRASLALTETNVAMMERLVAEQERGGAGAPDPRARSAALVGALEAPQPNLAQQLAERTDQEATDAAAAAVEEEVHMIALREDQDPDKIAEELADAIADELEDLGGKQVILGQEDAVLQVETAPSLDIAHALARSEAPSIWLPTKSAGGSGSPSPVSSSGGAVREGVNGEERAADGSISKRVDDGAGSPAVGLPLPDSEPGSPVVAPLAPEDVAAPPLATSADAPPTLQFPAPEAAPPMLPANADPLPSREALASVRSRQRRQRARLSGSVGDLLSGRLSAASSRGGSRAEEDDAASVGSAGARSQPSSVHEMASVKLRVPTVLTPSQYVNRLAGKLPAKALSEVYAGRHEHVSPDLLEQSTYYLKYAYAVYSLTPKIEGRSSLLDALACCRPPAPQDVVFAGFNELERMEDDSSVELLHLNCSNRMLAHLPYLIALHHTRKSVVLAIRGTISAADIVTDAMVASKPVDDLVPEPIRARVEGPCFAHAGMVAAAGAIFADMKERGILGPLLGGAASREADAALPPREQARFSRAGGNSMYDADTGPGPGGATTAQKLGDAIAAPVRAIADSYRGGRRSSSGGIDEERYDQTDQGAAYSPRCTGSADEEEGGEEASGEGGGRAQGGRQRPSVPSWSDARGGNAYTKAQAKTEQAAQVSGDAARPSTKNTDTTTTSPKHRNYQPTQPSTTTPASSYNINDDIEAQTSVARRKAGGEEPAMALAGSKLAHAAADDDDDDVPPPVRIDREGEDEASPGRRVGAIMREKIFSEGWQLRIVGHSLGAGAAALISLMLHESIPDLRCFAFSCPGALVSRNLAREMAGFVTTVVVGKDAVPRASVANLGRLVDEMVTSLARCKQPKLTVRRRGGGGGGGGLGVGVGSGGWVTGTHY